MATKKVQFKIGVSPEVKAEMDSHYESICCLVSNYEKSKFKVVGYNDYWEIVFKDHLAANSDYLKSLKETVNDYNKTQ